MAVSPTLIPCDPCKCYGVGGAEKWEGQGQKIIPELIPCTTSNETCCQKSKDPVHVSITSCLCSPNKIAAGGNITKWTTQAWCVCAAWDSELLAGSSRTDSPLTCIFYGFFKWKMFWETHMCLCVSVCVCVICLLSKCNNANRALSTDCFAS